MPAKNGESISHQCRFAKIYLSISKAKPVTNFYRYNVKSFKKDGFTLKQCLQLQRQSNRLILSISFRKFYLHSFFYHLFLVRLILVGLEFNSPVNTIKVMSS